FLALGCGAGHGRGGAAYAPLGVQVLEPYTNRHANIIDQPGAAHARGDQQTGVPGLRGLAEIGATKSKIVNLDALGVVENGTGGGQHRFRAVLGDKGTGRQCRGKGEGELALLVGEVDVAAGQRQSAALADDRNAVDTQLHVEVVDHLLDQDELLVVL